MNYSKIYEQLIKKAQSRNKPNCYTEQHHIIPKSEGGSNENTNLVYLTAKEHFIAHKLLYVIEPTNYNRMMSFLMMSNRFHTKWGNTYEEAKIVFSEKHHYKSEKVRMIMTKPKTEEHKRKISEGNKGKPKSKEHIEKIKANLPDRYGANNANYGKGYPVIIDGIEYPNVSQAYKKLGINKTNAYYFLKSDKHPNWKYKNK
jgi:hypothetical protein